MEQILAEIPIGTLQQDVDKTMDLIKYLPPELREKIYKYFVEKTIKEKLEMGFHAIHFDIKNAPYCSKRKRITKVFMCEDCIESEYLLLGDPCKLCSYYNEHAKNLCFSCYRDGVEHYIFDWEYLNIDYFKLV